MGISKQETPTIVEKKLGFSDRILVFFDRKLVFFDRKLGIFDRKLGIFDRTSVFVSEVIYPSPNS